VPYKHVYQSNPVWKAMDFDDFQNKLIALEALAEGRILINLDQREIVLRQEPTKIIEKFGERLRCKTETAQINEALCKVLCHNLCCVIQSMYELGVDPTFGVAAAA
jgi:hypothetical protein